MSRPACDQPVKNGGFNRGGQVADQVFGRPAQSVRQQQPGLEAWIFDAGRSQAKSALAERLGDGAAGPQIIRHSPPVGTRQTVSPACTAQPRRKPAKVRRKSGSSSRNASGPLSVGNSTKDTLAPAGLMG